MTWCRALIREAKGKEEEIKLRAAEPDKIWGCASVDQTKWMGTSYCRPEMQPPLGWGIGAIQSPSTQPLVGQ